MRNSELSSLINELDYKDLAPLLTKVGYSSSFIMLVEEELAISLSWLSALEKKDLGDELLELELRKFLALRWGAIQGCNADYLAFPHSPINQICIKIAEKIATKEEPILQILCPSVTVDDYLIISENLIDLTQTTEGHLSPCTFILNDLGNAVIPLYPWFEAQTNNASLLYTQLYNSKSNDPTEQSILLTESEKERLRHCLMPASYEFISQFEYRHQLRNKPGSLASAVSKLHDGLYQNGEGYKGTATKMHDDGFAFIAEFSDVLNKISETDRKKILSLKDRQHPFEYYWRVISDPRFDPDNDKRNNLQTCVQVNARCMANIMVDNFDIFAGIPIGQGPANAPVESFKILLESIAMKISEREKSLAEYLDKSNGMSDEVRNKKGADALKPYYQNNEQAQRTKLDCYRSRLASSSGMIPEQPISNLDELSYFHCSLSPEDFNDLLGKQSDETLQNIFYEALRLDSVMTEIFANKRVGKAAEFLLQAIRSGNIRFVRAYLIEFGTSLNFGASFSSQETSDPLVVALSHHQDEIAALLIKSKYNCDGKIGIEGRTVLSYALQQNKQEIVEALFKRRDILWNEPSHYGVTALHAAAAMGNCSAIEKLIARGADINLKNTIGYNAVIFAMMNHKLQAVIALIVAGADLSGAYVDQLSSPLLCYAIKMRYENIIQTLLAHGKSYINQVDNNGWNALHYAADAGRFDLLPKLLENGIDINSKTLQSSSALSIAIDKGDKGQIDFALELIKKGADPSPIHRGYWIDHWEGSLLVHAIRNGYAQIIDALLEIGSYDLNDTDYHGYTAFYAALVYGRWELADKLLAKGVKIDHKYGAESALSLAMKAQKIKLALTLIQKGADISGTYEGELKVPLLCYAIKTVANEIIHALLSHEKLNLNQLDKNGLSALHYAALYARLDLVELLLSKGCDLNQKNDDGHTPLYLAVSNGCTAVAVSLIEKGADLSETFQYKLKTPLLNYVIKSGNTAIFNALISSDKIDLRKTDIYRSTPLHIAALNGQLDMLKALLLKDVDINQKDRDGHDALYFAIYYHKYDLAIVLINKGANLNEMINFYTDELPLLAFLNTIGTRADVVCAILDKDLDLTAYSPKQLSATLTIFENDVALIPYITLLMKAGAIPSSEQLNFLLDKQMIIPLDELLENRSLHELTRRFKFDQLCNLANIQENSFEGLLLYATSVNQGLPPAAPKAQALSKALASLDPHQLCDALKLPDRKQVFWSRSDSWSHMPQKLKDFVERENVPLFPGISSKDRG